MPAKKPRKPRKLPEYLTVDEVRQLLKTPYPIEKRDRLILELLVRLGLRASELCDMQIENVNFERVEIRVRGKGQKDRILPIPGCLVRPLKDYIDNEKSGPMFGIGRRALYYLVVGYAKRADISRIKVHPHALRHTYAVSLIKAGVDIRTVQLQLGHANLNTTAIYLALTTADRRETLENHPLGY